MTNERRVLVHPDKASLASSVSARFITKMLDILDTQAVAHVVLTGGSMGSAVLEAVSSSPARTTIDWSRGHFWWGDERWVPERDAERNVEQARVALLDDLGVPVGNVHPFPSPDSGMSIGVVAMAALWFALPNLPAPKSVGVMAEIRVLGRGPVLGALALTVVGSGAMFTVFTYIAPILSSETHASTAYITAMLVLFGVGLTLGNMWGGKAADRSIDRTLIVSLSVLILVLLAFTVLMRWPLPAAVAILIWGIASFALVPPLQMRVMEAAKDAPNLASAVNIGAFNFGNAIGAALGGAVINTGLGYPAISLAGAAMAGLGLLMVLAFAWRSRTIAAAVV